MIGIPCNHLAMSREAKDDLCFDSSNFSGSASSHFALEARANIAVVASFGPVRELIRLSAGQRRIWIRLTAANTVINSDP